MRPRTRRLSDLLAQADVTALDRLGPDPEVRAAVVDSRRTGAGDVFCAIRGFRTDGEAYIGQALARGASAIVAASARPESLDASIGWARVDDPRRAAGRLARASFDRPDEKLSLVGVTGTNGKTTVTYLVEAIARAAGRRAGRIGTTGGAFDEATFSLSRTTPEAPELYELLADMAEAGADLVALEVSSHALALSRVEGAQFAVAAFLNLSTDHLDFHGDVDRYFEAKSRLFDGLAPGGTAVLPADSDYRAALAKRVADGARKITFGRGSSSDVRIVDEHNGLDGSSAILETPVGRLPLRSFLLGRANLDNVAAAAACAIALDLPAESIPRGVLALEAVPGRMERVRTERPFTVLVDYAHTPAALRAALTWLRPLCEARLVVVFGCGGERDRGKRPQMGRVAAELADVVVLTSDNPRNEPPETILDEIAAGAGDASRSGGRLHRIENRAAAIGAALSEANEGDVVVIAGKGHETTQTIEDRVIPFDDREVARHTLGELEDRRGAGA